MDSQDCTYEWLIALLLGRRAHLERVLGQLNEGGPRDSYGRASFLVQGAERLRVEDELRYIRGALAGAGV
jgi:hypothetical protein